MIDKKKQSGLLINIFCIILSIMFVLYYSFIRIGLGIDYELIFKSISFACLTIILPLVLADIKQTSINYSLFLQGLYTITILLILAIIGYLRITIPTTFLYCIAGITAVFFFSRFLKLTFSIRQGPYYLLFIIIAFGIVVFTYGGNFLSPLFVEKIIYKGELQPDTIFNISLANIFKNHHVVSLGFNGLEFFRYHFGSHVLFGSLSKTLGVDMVSFYNITYTSAIIPLFFRFFFNLILTVTKEIKIHVFILFLLFLLSFNRIFYSTEIGLYAFPFNSETYLTGLIFFFFGLQLLYLISERWRWLTNVFQNGSLFILFPIIVFLISVTKISLGYFFYFIAGYLIARNGLIREFRCQLSLILSGILFLLIFRLTSYSDSEGFSLFHTVKTLNWIAGHLLTYFLLFWISLLLYLRTSRANTIRELIVLGWREKFWPLEILIVTLVLGIIPGLLFSMGNNWIYFTDVHSWLALVVIILMVPVLDYQNLWNKVVLYIILIGLGARFISFSADIFKANIKERNEIISLIQFPANNPEAYERKECIENIKRLSEIKNSCAVIAPDDKIWSMFNQNNEYIPVLVPAFSGAPLIINEFPLKVDIDNYYNRFLKPFMEKGKSMNITNDVIIISSKPFRVIKIN
jgi:hypothetical protein